MDPHYKSEHMGVMIWPVLVNTQTDRQLVTSSILQA